MAFKEFEDDLIKFKTNEDHIDIFNKYISANHRIKPLYIKELLEHLISISQSLNYKFAYAWCAYWLAWHYHDSGKYKLALKYRTESHELFVECNDYKGICATYNGLLSDYTRLGMLDLAIEFGLKGLNITTDTDFSYIPLSVNTAHAYLEGKYYKEALDILNRLLTVGYELRDQSKIIINLDLATIYLSFNNPKEALNYCNIAEDLIEKSDLSFFNSEFFNVKAKIYSSLEKYSEAEKFFKASLKNSLKYNDVNTYIETMLEFGKYDVALGKYESAIKKFLSALSKHTSDDYYTKIKDCYNELSVAYYKIGDYKNAFENTRKYIDLEKEMFNDKSSIYYAKLHNNKVKEEAKVYKLLYNQIEVISKIGKKITSNLKTNNILEYIYEETQELFDIDYLVLATHKKDTNVLDYGVFVDPNQNHGLGMIPLDASTSLGAFCFNNIADIFINSLDEEYINYINEHPYSNKYPQSIIFCPITIDRKAIGVISIQNYKKNSFTVHDLNKLRILSSYIAIALENNRLFQEFRHLATYDDLTGILNRREILNNGKDFLSSINEKNHSLGILIVDIDDFKKINDTHGHLYGDYALKDVAKSIKSQIRESDLVGRYGGEEFLILLPNITNQNLKIIAENIRKTVECHRIQTPTSVINITLSLGAYIIKNSTESLSKGVTKADMCLYKAKNSGKNKFVNYE